MNTEKANPPLQGRIRHTAQIKLLIFITCWLSELLRIGGYLRHTMQRLHHLVYCAIANTKSRMCEMICYIVNQFCFTIAYQIVIIALSLY